MKWAPFHPNASQYPISISAEPSPSQLEANARLRAREHGSKLITVGNRNRQGELKSRPPPKGASDPQAPAVRLDD